MLLPVTISINKGFTVACSMGIRIDNDLSLEMEDGMKERIGKKMNAMDRFILNTLPESGFFATADRYCAKYGESERTAIAKRLDELLVYLGDKTSLDWQDVVYGMKAVVWWEANKEKIHHEGARMAALKADVEEMKSVEDSRERFA